MMHDNKTKPIKGKEFLAQKYQGVLEFLEEYDEGGYLGINEDKLALLLDEFASQFIPNEEFQVDYDIYKRCTIFTFESNPNI